MKSFNLIGQRFGRLVVVEYLRTDLNGKVYSTLCDCGTIGECTTGRLTSGNTKSCGCFEAISRGESLTDYVPLINFLGALEGRGLWAHENERGGCF